MRFGRTTDLPADLLITLILSTVLVGSLSMAALDAGSLAVARSTNDLILSFPTVTPNLYVVQVCSDLRQPWTSLQSAIQGDGTVKTVSIPNALSAEKGFYR